eukprot:scaffold49746_cov37-Tisochrysis_lutea.AAC.1
MSKVGRFSESGLRMRQAISTHRVERRLLECGLRMRQVISAHTHTHTELKGALKGLAMKVRARQKGAGKLEYTAAQARVRAGMQQTA